MCIYVLNVYTCGRSQPYINIYTYTGNVELEDDMVMNDLELLAERGSIATSPRPSLIR
jgi:hypothetical protein